ncbi:hypothetical protein KM043_000968 [Ampulex compressa]|nr:hypothetical protein KM043_000968 [Ampulex compressa]
MYERKYGENRSPVTREIRDHEFLVKNGQFLNEQEKCIGAAVGNCEESTTLCAVLEAIFLHGLKDSLLNRMTEVLSGPDFDAMPQPSFWGPLLVFSHRQIIDQIQALNQVTTEVGYCRAWIRLALNEGILASYFFSIRRDNSALKPYYNKSAFIRDRDLVEVAQKLVESLEYVRFELDCDSARLNYWSSTPLLVAGIWSPPMKSCPIFSAIDIAKTITTEAVDDDNPDEVENASSIGSLISFDSSQSALNNIMAVTEDEALKVILTNENAESACIQPLDNILSSTTNTNCEEGNLLCTEEAAMQTPRTSTPKKNGGMNAAYDVSSVEDTVLLTNSNDTEPPNEGAGNTVGNSLIGRLGWSTLFEDCESSLTTSMISHGSATDATRTPGEGPTYDALIKSYHTAGSARLPDLKEFLQKYPAAESMDKGSKLESDVKVPINFDEQLGKLPREKGLDIQNYGCFDCGYAIGMAFSKALVCSYSGNYYCSKCMAQGEHLIPSRMIYNWDLKRYPVCQKAALYLEDSPALIDLKILNPQIYMAVDTMAQLQSLRIQLNLLRAYLFTCREPIIESLQKKVSPRDYLYEHVHQYSVSDLLDIPNGTLAQHLQKVVEFARNHVVNCWLCSQKGFICEMCDNPKVIYPFDMESTYRCGACNAVFHIECLNANRPCPKCERRRRRMDLPLLDMGCAELPIDAASASPVRTN